MTTNKSMLFSGDQDIIREELGFLVGNWEKRMAYADQAPILDFIKSRFSKYGAAVTTQEFRLDPSDSSYTDDGSVFTNIIASYRPESGPRILIGAHYDVCGNPGADDNGSGIAGLLALARRLQGADPAKRIRPAPVAAFFSHGLAPHERPHELLKRRIQGGHDNGYGLFTPCPGGSIYYDNARQVRQGGSLLVPRDRG
jgi:hypothetical protein